MSQEAVDIPSAPPAETSEVDKEKAAEAEEESEEDKGRIDTMTMTDWRIQQINGML